jgi:fatty-acyl-CoA synthase
LRIDLEIEKYSGLPIDFSNRRKPAAQDKALLIYTSGTTGLPKAAKVTHARLVEWSYWFAGMMDAQASDRLYNCLPMYHSIGGVVAVGSMLVAGGSVLIRERFSVSRFWADVIDGECTIFQYIGELCRYLANSQPDPRETQHRLRLCCGNGMRGDVWEIFQARFRIPQILEFYAATEGNVSLYNCEGKPGAIGRVPAFLNHRFPIALIRCDPDSGEPLRDENGFCVRCAADEPGEAIGKILRTGESQFDGYTDAKASAAKVLQHVFADDDRWFRTGDLMHKDSSGYYYFVDRLGDTYRWKGENVSTAEVAGVVRRCPGVIEATVYGVAVAGHEGRAGMAAITTDEDFSLVTLQQHLAANLPEYARPLFVRICESIEITSTFKMKNDRLSREGYLAVTAPDTVWFYDAKGGVYVKCDEQLRELIGTGGLNRKRSVQQQ